MGSFSRHLHDAFYMYASAVSRADDLEQDGRKNAMAMKRAMQGSFQGLTGQVALDSTGTRVPHYVVYGVDKDGEQWSFMKMTSTDDVNINVSLLYTDEASVWATRGGRRPLTRPLCGYTGTECPLSFWDQYLVYIVVGGSLLFVVIISLICLVICIVRAKRVEMARLNAEWQIPSVTLISTKKIDRRSRRSLQSGPSTTTGDSTFGSDKSKFEVFAMDKELVLVTKHPPLQLTSAEKTLFVKGLYFLHRSFVGAIGTLEFINMPCQRWLASENH
ncbi:hypothetical protein OSTOST_20933 [Ostertagia ostertagi]